MTYNEILQEIISRLGVNYVETDRSILESLLKEKINLAIYISNRDINVSDPNKKDDNLGILSPEIIQATIIGYQERGVEYTRSQSELGQSNSFIDVDETLRTNIIKNGKRVIY